MENKLTIEKIRLSVPALLCAAALLAGCQKDGPSLGKGAVNFGAKVSGKAATRTNYSGVDVQEGTTLFERINWANDDPIRIYSPEAIRRVDYEQGNRDQDLYYWSDYQITGAVDNGRYSDAKLKPLTSDGSGKGYDQESASYNVGNGLFWDGLDKASFYAVYPSPADNDGKLTDEGKGNSIDGTNGLFTFTLPKEQIFKEKGDLSKYGFMTAVKKDVKSGDLVDLEFFPAFTAFEISVGNESEESMVLRSFALESYGVYLSGTYTADLSQASSGAGAKYDNISGDYSIGVDLGDYSLGSGETVTFTVFALPKYDLINLTVKFDVSNDGGTSFNTRSLALNKDGGPIKFEALKKHRIKNLVLPSGVWQLEVNGQVLPWTSYETTVNDQVSIQGKVTIDGAIEGTKSWQTAVGGGRNNHYEAYNDYDKYYQIRTLNRDLPEDKRYFTMEFAPTAPTGGYWQLIPTYKNEESKKHFRFEVYLPGGEFTTQLTGQILNRTVTIKIYPVDWDPSDVNTYDMWFVSYFSPSKNFNPSINADSEFQDVHGDGRFSYWTFRLQQYQGTYIDE